MASNHSIRKVVDAETIAQALLVLLADRGIEYMFATAGSDFAPILDAFAWAKAGNRQLVTPVTVPHEMVATSMAHGYYLATGRPQMVMTHATVGTANAMAGIINAARDHIPVIFAAGRTPVTEQGIRGSRDTFSHWAQESFDPAAMLREYVKWDYELRGPGQLETVIDRAVTLAMSPPRGPVFLTLPREVLAFRFTSPFSYMSPMRQSPASAGCPAPANVREAADLLAAARRPMIITTSVGRDVAAAGNLIELAELGGFPVVVTRSRYMNFPTGHPLHLGFDPHAFLSGSGSPEKDGADVILVVDSDVPWNPSRGGPAKSAHVIQMAVDPFFSRYPIRGFPCDVALAGNPAQSLALLTAALRGRLDASEVDRRKSDLAALHAAQRARWKAVVLGGASAESISMAWATHCIDAVKDDDTLVVNEYDMSHFHIGFSRPGTVFEHSPASGLGWGLGAALGIKLGAKDRTVIAIVGDGSYMLGLPTSAHYVGTAYQLPTLTVILNNGAWNSVRKANLRMHDGGWAERTGHFPLTELTPSPRFELVAEACGAYGRCVSDPSLLMEELRKALNVVRNEGRQAVVNVLCKNEASLPSGATQ